MNPLHELHGKTVGIVGPVVWDPDGTRGLCDCPGKHLHTGRSAASDTTVFLEGAPTIYCFHTTCRTAVADANLKLRRALAGSAWELILPDGCILRSGEQRIAPGQPLPPRIKKPTVVDLEKRMLADIAMHMARLKPALLAHFAWDPVEMVEGSPISLAGDPALDWASWLDLWDPIDVIWVGDTFDSGSERHRENFRLQSEWRKLRHPIGPFTCGSSFSLGTFARKNEHAIRKFMVIESDTLSKAETGGVFKFLRQRLGYPLSAVVDTGGKSLHGWFGIPPNKIFENRLKAALTTLGCDPALFKPSQPVRVPGAMRSGEKRQALLWIQPRPQTA